GEPGAAALPSSDDYAVARKPGVHGHVRPGGPGGERRCRAPLHRAEPSGEPTGRSAGAALWRAGGNSGGRDGFGGGAVEAGGGLQRSVWSTPGRALSERGRLNWLARL